MMIRTRPKNWQNFCQKTHYACNLQICKNILILFHLLFFGESQRFFSSLFLFEFLMNFLHIFKLIDPTFSIAFSHFTQGLILVSTLFYIFLVDSIHGGFSRLYCGVRELILERAELILQPFVALGQGQTIVDRVVDYPRYHEDRWSCLRSC